jgi:hypothetical protein
MTTLADTSMPLMSPKFVKEGRVSALGATGDGEAGSPELVAQSLGISDSGKRDSDTASRCGQ